VTIVGFGRYIAFIEINPHILFLMRYMDRYLAASLVFLITLAFTLGSYWLVAPYFKSHPYDGDLKRVWRYLCCEGVVKRRDLVIFALIAVYVYLTCIHVWGAWTWLRLFMQ